MLAGSVHDVARGLLGSTMLRNGVGGIIVEVEAYASDDPASHSFRGRTPRNGSMFEVPGTLYVYRSYGVHWCVNVACEREGVGAAVLIRALQPTQGIDEMRMRRGVPVDCDLCSGPGKLTQALGIDGHDDGRLLGQPPFSFEAPGGRIDVVTTPRVGISKAADLPWRYVIRGTRWASRGPRPT